MHLSKSEEFRKYFLLEFTKQLIINSLNTELQKVSRNLQEEKKVQVPVKQEFGNLIKKRVDQSGPYAPSIKKEIEKEGTPIFTGKYKGLIKQDVSQKRTIFIPEPKLPERLRYLKPLPTKGEIDLGKINNFIQDPVVRVIECNGPEQGIVIGGNMGKKETNVTLSKEEIEEIIKKFSEETKIPLEEGFFKVALKKLIISAIYSESVGSKFVIQKIISPEKQNPQLMGASRNFSQQNQRINLGTNKIF